jgi:hypothetical protein
VHKENASRGLVVISVSVDELDKKKDVEAANAFLREQNPPFVNLLLDESQEFWSKKLGFNIPPYYYVFDRRGKWVRFDPNEHGDDLHKVMDKAILRMLEEK